MRGQISWRRYLYWNDAQNDALLSGQVTDKALLHHVETAVFTEGLLDNAYGDGTSGSSAIAETELSGAGYTTGDGYLWNPGLIQHYSIGDFYLPIRTEDRWGNGVLVEWDESYRMAPIKTTDALGNTTQKTTLRVI